MEKWGSDYSKPPPVIKNLKLMFEMTINTMDKWTSGSLSPRKILLKPP